MVWCALHYRNRSADRSLEFRWIRAQGRVAGNPGTGSPQLAYWGGGGGVAPKLPSASLPPLDLPSLVCVVSSAARSVVAVAARCCRLPLSPLGGRCGVCLAFGAGCCYPLPDVRAAAARGEGLRGYHPGRPLVVALHTRWWYLGGVSLTVCGTVALQCSVCPPPHPALPPPHSSLPLMVRRSPPHRQCQQVADRVYLQQIVSTDCRLSFPCARVDLDTPVCEGGLATASSHLQNTARSACCRWCLQTTVCGH